MTSLSIYLGKLIGTTLIFLGLACIIRKKHLQNTVKEISISEAFMTIISIIPLVAGLAIIYGHPYWKEDLLSLSVTLMGYVIFAMGLIRLFFYKKVMKNMNKICSKKSFINLLGSILILLGAYFLLLAI
ncbi:MAG TPA: hypothetical protein P5048_02620 [Chlamydiales bacterium]|mgnify:CR=1 FL=1|nr:hypothetical protein [Chlamydiales bacterium]